MYIYVGLQKLFMLSINLPITFLINQLVVLFIKMTKMVKVFNDYFTKI